MSELLETCSEVDGIAVTIPILDDHLAEVNPDAYIDASLVRKAAIAFEHRALQRYCATYSIYDAGKFGQEAVAHEFEDAAVVPCDLRLKQFLAVRPDSFERAQLIRAHQPTVTYDIRRQNGC
jgi:hypothetical protein